MNRTPAAAELPRVAGGPISDFTRGVFGLWLLAAARTPWAAATARASATAESAEDRLEGLNPGRERIPIGVYGVGQ
jgi:hypothetical protein